MRFKFLALLIALSFIHIAIVSNAQSLKEQLEHLPGVISVDSILTDTVFGEQWEVYFEQAIDHKNPKLGSFNQKVIVSNVDIKAPVVLVLEGYSIGYVRQVELTEHFQCNQINIEHRFFKNSRPDSIPWEKLTIWQAATDQHKIINALQTIYKNNWLSTGVSKGGQTTIFHRSFYPNDVKASVPYVAPINLAREDDRIYKFLNSVGTKEEREKIYNFQYLCFDNFNELLKRFQDKAKAKNWTYNMGFKRALEYTILEYSFALWQYGGATIDEIPDSTATPRELFEHLGRISGFTFFEDASVKSYHPFFWAALTEIGMYGYETKPFKKYLGDTTVYTFDFSAPQGTNPVYSNKSINEVIQFLDTEASNILFIVGELDTWGATAYYPSGKNNLVTKVLMGGHHGASINDFPEEERKEMYSLLETWMDIE